MKYKGVRVKDLVKRESGGLEMEGTTKEGESIDVCVVNGEGENDNS